MLVVSNVHEREYPVPVDRLGALLDTLSSENDQLWPKNWPPVRFDGPLAVGARGGHGPIRYSVSAYEPGRRLECRFDPAMGAVGTHELQVRKGTQEGTSVLRHVLVISRTTGRMRLLWPLAVRWLHDELLEELLDRAEAAVGRAVTTERRPLVGRLIRFGMSVLAPTRSSGRETVAPVSR